jgi:hypothetical protein
LILVTQSFGRESEYKRAILSVWSYWVHRPSGKVLLFTDAPDYFSYFFKSMPIQYVALSPEKIQEMRGSIDFLHRMKIALLEEAFSMTDDDLLYADSDTFFVDDVTDLEQQVAPRRAFMHMREYRLDSLRNMRLPAAKPFHDFLDLIAGHAFTGVDGKSIPVSLMHYSWNAGVMALHRSHSHLLRDVFALTDQFYPSTQNHASEQYAFSIVLQNNAILGDCEDTVYHYWYRVKKQVMDAFLAKALNDRWSNFTVDEKKESVKKWVAILPTLLQNHKWALRDNAIQAFNENRFRTGYSFAVRALMKNPFDVKFLLDLMYHTKRLMRGQ